MFDKVSLKYSKIQLSQYINETSGHYLLVHPVQCAASHRHTETDRQLGRETERDEDRWRDRQTDGTYCAVENEGSLVIGEFVDGRGVQFWNCRRESNCHMAKHWGCCEVEPPSELLFYVPELRLANLRPGWLLHGTEFSRLSDPECRHPGPTGRCHTASDWPSEHLCTGILAHIADVFPLPVVQEILALKY